MSYILKDIIEKIIQREQLWKVHLLSQWATIMGTLSTKISCEKIDGDTLTLGVQDSCWMQEVYLLSPTIISKINQSLDQPRIKKLFLKQMRTARRSPVIKKSASKKVLSAVSFSLREKAALEIVRDTTLQEVLSNFLTRCYQERYGYEK